MPLTGRVSPLALNLNSMIERATYNTLRVNVVARRTDLQTALPQGKKRSLKSLLP